MGEESGEANEGEDRYLKKKGEQNMKKMFICVLTVILIFGWVMLGGIVYAQPKGDIKIGALIPYTGMGNMVAKDMERSFELGLDELGWKIAGRKVILIKEDETDDPAIAVAKARKLVEEDKVVMILGPLLAHTSAAVAGYLARLKIVNFTNAMTEKTRSDDSFYVTGSGASGAYPAGLYAYGEMGARTAALMDMDYIMGAFMEKGFTIGFEERGGKVVSKQRIPMGTADMAPFIEAIPPNVNILGLFLIAPSDIAFVRQYQQYGLKIPVIFTVCQPQSEEILAQMGDRAIGMFGNNPSSIYVDNPMMKQWGAKWKAKYGKITGGAMYPTGLVMYAKAVEASKGDTSYDKLVPILKNLQIEVPTGTFKFTDGRMAVQDYYILQVVKEGDRYYWKPIKKYLQIPPM